MSAREQLLLEIETARMRHVWAKAEVEKGTITPALRKFVEDSFKEWRALEATIPKPRRALSKKPGSL